MGKPVNYTAGIKQEYCALANHQNCDPSNDADCPLNPLIPDDLLSDLPDRCVRVQELCRPGDPSPWWTMPETRPDCGFQLVPGPEETETVQRVCSFPAALTSGSSSLVITTGPVTKMLSPAPGSYVRGVVAIDGWMRDEQAGVTGTLGFWLDKQHVYPTAVVYGEADAAGCSGSSDPNCPYVGFSASLDTTVFTDGPHTLEMMGAQDVAEWPSPAYGKTTFTIDNTKPAVTITAPTAGAAISGTVQVAASASDAYGVELVSFYVDGVYQGSDAAAPFTFSLDTTSWSDGGHTLRARAWDRAGNGRVSEIGVNFANDLQAPQVALVKPAPGGFARGSVTVEAQASDDQGVSYVEFFVDGALLATDATAPYRITWATTGHTDGPHTLTARAVDALGETGYSQAVTVTVDNTIPKVYVDAPANGAVVQGSSVKVAGWAIDASGIAGRTFKVDGQPIQVTGLVTTVNRGDVCTNNPGIPDPACPSVGWRAYFDATALSNGGHTLEVSVTDRAGNVRTFNRSFVVQNSVTASFHPVADATAWQAYPSYNDGTSSLLGVRTPSGGYGAYAFLKFQVGGIQGQVTSARLRVRTSGSMYDLWLYWLVHSNWTESNLTWNAFPGPGGEALDHAYNLSGQTWYSFDVSGFVAGNGTYSLGFASSNASYTYLWSRESSDKPVLEVTYVP